MTEPMDESDLPIEYIKAAWKHGVAHNFDTPEKAATHVCDPANPDCAAYLHYLNPENWTRAGGPAFPRARAARHYRCTHGSISGQGLRRANCGACGPMRRVAA